MRAYEGTVILDNTEGKEDSIPASTLYRLKGQNTDGKLSTRIYFND